MLESRLSPLLQTVAKAAARCHHSQLDDKAAQVAFSALPASDVG
jgi:hypothetical protein